MRRAQGLHIWTVVMMLASIAPAMAQSPTRIASLNMCTDQLLLDLAPREHIAGLSPYARDPRSWSAARAGNIPLMSGTAEDVIVLNPDLVVTGRFSKPETRDMIRSRQIRVEEFNFVRSLADTKAQIMRMAKLVGAEARGHERVAELDAAIARLKTTASATKIRILPLARRGWIAGQDSLTSELLTLAGLVNSASELGLGNGGFVQLETIVKLRPDAILVSRSDDRAEDQGRALLLHPAIADLFPPERRLIMPESLTVCGGPMLVEAMNVLTRQIANLKPR